MASLSIDYPLAQQDRILNGMAAAGGWSPELGIAKGPFVKKMIADYIKRTVVHQERMEAQAAALAATPTPVDPDIT